MDGQRRLSDLTVKNMPEHTTRLQRQNAAKHAAEVRICAH